MPGVEDNCCEETVFDEDKGASGAGTIFASLWRNSLAKTACETRTVSEVQMLTAPTNKHMRIKRDHDMIVTSKKDFLLFFIGISSIKRREYYGMS